MFEVIKASKGYAKMIRFSTIINEEKLRSTEASNNLLIFFVLSVSSKNILTFLTTFFHFLTFVDNTVGVFSDQ